MREAEELFRLTFEHAPVGMAICTLDGIATALGGPMATTWETTARCACERCSNVTGPRRGARALVVLAMKPFRLPLTA
jgi:hypothetical protein